MTARSPYKKDVIPSIDPISLLETISTLNKDIVKEIKVIKKTMKEIMKDH